MHSGRLLPTGPERRTRPASLAIRNLTPLQVRGKNPFARAEIGTLGGSHTRRKIFLREGVKSSALFTAMRVGANYRCSLTDVAISSVLLIFGKNG